MNEEVSKTEADKTEPAKVSSPQSRSATIRKWFFYILIGGLIVSAVISVTAVLIGEINDVVARSLWTTFIMVIHALIAVSLLSVTTRDQNTVADTVALNVLVGLTIASFITAVLGIWEVFSGSVVGDLYKLMFYALFADLLIFFLLHSWFIDKAIARSAYVSISLTVAFFIYLIPSVFTQSLNYVLPDVYGRGVAAFSILLSTSVVITIIFHWVYALKHREARAKAKAEAIARGEEVPAETKENGMPVWLKVILIVIAVLFGLPILMSILGIIFMAFSRFM